MAYLSSTSTSPNVPFMLYQPIASLRTWFYSSTHISSDIEEANFFNDGLTLGFEIRDVLLHQAAANSTNSGTAHTMITVSATGTQVSVGTTYFAQFSTA